VENKKQEKEISMNGSNNGKIKDFLEKAVEKAMENRIKENKIDLGGEQNRGFCSEADFKYYLANEIHQELKNQGKPYFEVPTKMLSKEYSDDKWVDIVIELTEQIYPIEIKLWRSQNDVDTPAFERDISRLQVIIDKSKNEKMKTGYGILVDNSADAKSRVARSENKELWHTDKEGYAYLIREV
jgi:hypothetical protein